MGIAKARERNEGVTIGTDPEVEAESDRLSVEGETKTRLIVSKRRQGRPTAVISARAPGHPRGTPNAVRPPAPTPARMAEPAPVMERCRAPGIIRKPVPAAIAVNPMTTIAVWLPAAIDH